MAAVTVVRSIDSPAERVFRVVADAERFARAISGVTKTEFLSEARSGAGTRFRQTRLMNGKEMTMEFEVTEHVPDQRVRIVNETHGTVWDSLFTVAQTDSDTTLTMHMEARGQRLLPRLLNPLICRMIRKAVEKDIDAVKAFCEGRGGQDDGPT